MTEPLFERLIAKHPLEKPKGADLAALSKAYAKKAGYNGASGPWWRVWRAIERARGHRLRAAIAQLPKSDVRWFALWSFKRNRPREGIAIYRAYLADPGEIGPFDGETAEFLRHVITCRGAERALAEAERLSPELQASTDVAGVVAALLAEHRSGDLLARTPEPSSAQLHDGAAWARRAVALAKGGEDPATAIDRAAKLGVEDPKLEPLIQATFPDWDTRKAKWGYPTGEWQPGLRLAEAKGKPKHAFGGADFELPACKGCGHAEHQFLVFEVASIPDLNARIPAWAEVPLIGCVDCATWLVRRDYRIIGKRIETIAVGAEGKNLADLGKSYSTLDPIARVPVDVAAGTDEAAGSDRTQIGGSPDWVQDAERAFCPGCWNEMAFVAAHGSTPEPWLDTDFMVNNGSGNQYYFACNDCHVLSVFGQNT